MNFMTKQTRVVIINTMKKKGKENKNIREGG